MLDNLPSNGHQPRLQLPAKSALDPFYWGGPVNVAPKIEVCGGRIAGYSGRGRRYTSELSILYTLCGSCKRVIGNIFSSTRNCEQCLWGGSSGATVSIWCLLDGGLSYVEGWV